jgi:hypothetical protein
MKPVLAVLGIGIIILGLFGLGRSDWLGWLDIVLGILALVGAGALGRASRNVYIASSMAIGVGALVLWIIGLAVGVVPWLVWWTFAFGCAFILASFLQPGVTGGYGPPPANRP